MTIHFLYVRKLYTRIKIIIGPCFTCTIVTDLTMDGVRIVPRGWGIRVFPWSDVPANFFPIVLPGSPTKRILIVIIMIIITIIIIILIILTVIVIKKKKNAVKRGTRRSAFTQPGGATCSSPVASAARSFFSNKYRITFLHALLLRLTFYLCIYIN